MHVATKEEIDEAKIVLRSAKAGATGILRWNARDLVARITKLTAKLQNVGFEDRDAASAELMRRAVIITPSSTDVADGDKLGLSAMSGCPFFPIMDKTRTLRHFGFRPSVDV